MNYLVVVLAESPLICVPAAPVESDIVEDPEFIDPVESIGAAIGWVIDVVSVIVVSVVEVESLFASFLQLTRERPKIRADARMVFII